MRGSLFFRWRCWQGVPLFASRGAFSCAVRGLAFALPLRVRRDGRNFRFCCAVGSSGVCLLVLDAFRALWGFFGGLWRVPFSFACLPSLSNAPEGAKFARVAFSALGACSR